MFHDRGLNNKINRMHERSLKIVYGDSKSSLKELHRKDKLPQIHHKSLKVFARPNTDYHPR